MDCVILNKDILGYRINNLFYRYRFIKNLNIDVRSATPLRCVRISGHYITEDGQRISWRNLRTSTDYKKLLKGLYREGIRFKSGTIFIKKITRATLIDLKGEYSLSSYWGRTCTDSYEVLTSTGDTVGVVKFQVLDDKLYLKMIDIVAKNKGWGTIVVNKLLSEYGLPIEGYSCVEAKGFWKKIGAKFISNYDFRLEVR